MNRKILVVSMALIIVMLTVSVNAVLAETVRTDYQFAGGNAVLDIPGQPRINFVACGIWASDFGRADFVQIQVDDNPEGEPNFVAAVTYDDNPKRAAFSGGLGTPYPSYCVKPWQLQIFRIGKTTFVIWTKPLVAPATDTTPEVVVPPGLLVLRGSGESMSMVMPAPGMPFDVAIPIGDWFARIETNCYYEADATLFCRGWHHYGPVGEDYAATSVKERIWTWYDYNPNTPPP